MIKPVQITGNVRKHAPEQVNVREKAPGMEAKSKVFVQKGAEVCTQPELAAISSSRKTSSDGHPNYEQHQTQ
jgi:hypothetical protein